MPGAWRHAAALPPCRPHRRHLGPGAAGAPGCGAGCRAAQPRLAEPCGQHGADAGGRRRGAGWLLRGQCGGRGRREDEARAVGGAAGGEQPVASPKVVCCALCWRCAALSHASRCGSHFSGPPRRLTLGCCTVPTGRPCSGSWTSIWKIRKRRRHCMRGRAAPHPAPSTLSPWSKRCGESCSLVPRARRPATPRLMAAGARPMAACSKTAQTLLTSLIPKQAKRRCWRRLERKTRQLPQARCV